MPPALGIRIGTFLRGVMIEADIAKLSREQLREMVVERCSQFGSVQDVTIVMDSGRYRFALAAVEMSTPAESQAILRHLGDSLVHGLVVIRIELP
jgi:hypothetical protein